jgi:hypothetical protein
MALMGLLKLMELMGLIVVVYFRDIHGYMEY